MAHDKVEITVNKLATTVAKLDKVGFSGTDWQFTFTAMQGYSFKYSDGKNGLVFSKDTPGACDAKDTGTCDAKIVNEPVNVKVDTACVSVLAQFIGRPIRITVEFDASGKPENLTGFELGTV